MLAYAHLPCHIKWVFSVDEFEEWFSLISLISLVKFCPNKVFHYIHCRHKLKDQFQNPLFLSQRFWGFPPLLNKIKIYRSMVSSEACPAVACGNSQPNWHANLDSFDTKFELCTESSSNLVWKFSCWFLHKLGSITLLRKIVQRGFDQEPGMWSFFGDLKITMSWKEPKPDPCWFKVKSGRCQQNAAYPVSPKTGQTQNSLILVKEL